MNDLRRTLATKLLLWLQAVTPDEDIQTQRAIGDVAKAMAGEQGLCAPHQEIGAALADWKRRKG